MNTLINTREERQIKQLLQLAPDSDITFSYYELLGYFYGIGITPDFISPGEWVPVVFGDENPVYNSPEQARELIDTLLTVLNRYISGFHDNSLVMPFDLERLGEKDVYNVWEWTSGFDEALSLRPDCWEEPEGLSEEEQDHLMYSLIVVEGVVHPDDALDMFNNMPVEELKEIGVDLADNEAEKAMQIQFHLLQALALAVETIQNHGARFESERQARIRSSSIPFPVRSSMMGANDTCLCGSGESYKSCCGKKTRKTTGLYDVKSAKGKGKVIRGNFSQHRRDLQNKEFKKNEQPSPHGLIYQLEITLAYTDPSVWRRIQIPSWMTFEDLHMVIQLCFGWQDRHKHSFQAGVKFYGPQVADDYGDAPLLDESRFQLLQLERELLQGVLYTYDFADVWEHVVTLERVIPRSEAKPYPVLVDGARACPPEDIGGASGYQSFLRALATPESEEHDQVHNGIGLEDFDPDYLAIDAITELLQGMYGKKDDE